MSVKVRIAPSPTGNLHIGTARSALFNWLFARHHGGQFIVRIEDTDLERSTKEYEQNILDGLKWLGLESDTPIIRQTERKDIYRKRLESLLNEGLAFWCHHSVEELAQEKKRQMDGKEPLRHICNNKGTSKAQEPGQLIRLAVDGYSSRKVVFNDLIRGSIEWEEGHIGDLSLAKNLDTPLYNFAVVVDDIDMDISHVIRGEDHISNTPKQILIYEALGAKIPEFGHVPLILNSDKSKLSKRESATSVSDYEKDYLPESLLNFIGFLGYTYSKEILSKEEMAEEFDIKKVHKSGAVFDPKKLNWINAQYLKHISPEKLRELSGVSEIPENAVPFITERLEKISEVRDFDFFWQEPEYDKEILIWKNSEKEAVIGSLKKVKDIIQKEDLGDRDNMRLVLDAAATELGNRGLVYWPLRVALTGKERSPDPVDIAFVVGKEITIKRIDAALEKLS